MAGVPPQTRSGARWRRLALVLALIAASTAALLWAPGWLERIERSSQAGRTIDQFLASDRDESDVFWLGEQLRPLGELGARRLETALRRERTLDLLRAFEGLEPRVAQASMDRLIDLEDAELRHGVLLSQARFRRVEDARWREIASDPAEDRMVRLMAAHQAGLPSGWWREVDPGEPPSHPQGIGSRRVTLLREETTLGELARELAWAAGLEAVVEAGSEREPLRRVYYYHVRLEALLGDLPSRERYGVHELRLAEGELRVSRRHADER